MKSGLKTQLKWLQLAWRLHFIKKFMTYPSCRSRDFSDSKYLLHHAQFTSNDLPDSFKRLYPIKVTSEWCFACIHIKPVWKEAVYELEPLGESSIKRLWEHVEARQPNLEKKTKMIEKWSHNIASAVALCLLSYSHERWWYRHGGSGLRATSGPVIWELTSPLPSLDWWKAGWLSSIRLWYENIYDVEDFLPTFLVEKVNKDTSAACGSLKFNWSSFYQTFRVTVHSTCSTLLHPP